MATIFRAPVFTAIAVISTTVAINSQQPIQNRLAINSGTPPRSLNDDPLPNAPVLTPYVQDVRNRHVFLPTPTPQPPFNQSDWPTPDPPIRTLIADAILNPDAFLLRPVGTPFNFDDWLTPKASIAPPPGQIHHRPQLGPIVAPPFTESGWQRPANPGPQILVEPFRNGILLPIPAVGTPTSQHDWPLPVRVPHKPQEFLFYYIQDQTTPSFYQQDWPLPARVPSLTTEPIPNRILFPFVAPSAPFRQQDWPTASTRQIAKVVDPYNRNIFLPVPQGQPGHQHDWPLPQGSRSLQGSHTVNDLGILSVVVPKPVLPLDWPLPARVMLLSVIWTHEGTSPVYTPTFSAVWTMNSNRTIGMLIEPE